MAGVGGSGGKKMETTVLEQQFKKEREKSYTLNDSYDILEKSKTVETEKKISSCLRLTGSNGINIQSTENIWVVKIFSLLL